MREDVKSVIVGVGILAMVLSIPGILSAGSDLEEGIEEVVVTATRLETPVKEVGSSITVITTEQIDQMKVIPVDKLLETVPGVDVVRNGGLGQPSSVFIRGGKSEYTLVIIDGVEANDPFNPGRSFDFSNLTTDNIERIEVLRGPQSTLYGSDAMAGVVNIITRKGKGKPRFSLSAEGGSFNSRRANASVSGAGSGVDYSLSLSHLESDGISAADERDGNTETDGYTNTTVSGRVGVALSESADLDFILRGWDTETQADDYNPDNFFVFEDDPNANLETNQIFFRTQGSFLLANDLWETIVGISAGKHQKAFDNQPDPLNSVISTFSSDGRSLQVDWRNNLYLSRSNTLTLGVELEEERGTFESEYDDGFFPSSDFVDESSRETGIYAQDKINVDDSFFATLGLRWDGYRDFGSEVTWRVAPAYLIGNTGLKFRGSYGTGFNAPTLFQRYSGTDGNPDLVPETNTGWDVGLDKSFSQDRTVLGAAYFRTDYENLISWQPTGFENIAVAQTDGWELYLDSKLTTALTCLASYTYTRTEDDNGESLLRIPEDKASLRLNYSFGEKANLNLEALYVGERDDIDFSTFTRVQLDSYTLLNLAGSLTVTKWLEIYGRAQNLLDEQYQEVLGYGTPGISGYLGVRATI
jgi:vitamin B12 transporter